MRDRDLKRRFSTLDLLEAPDAWSAVEQRAATLAPSRAERSWHPMWIAAAAAAVTLILVGGLALLAGPRTSPAPPVTDPPPSPSISTTAEVATTTTTVTPTTTTGEAPSTTSAAPSTTTSTSLAPSTTAGGTTAPSTTALPPLTEVDLEINVTVFFDPAMVTTTAQAEAVIREIVGDDPVESITVVDRREAWAEAQALAPRAPTPFELDPALQNALGEVARVVVLDERVRNRLSDGIEDSADVFAVAYVVGIRFTNPPIPPGDRILWEILGYYWQPGA